MIIIAKNAMYMYIDTMFVQFSDIKLKVLLKSKLRSTVQKIPNYSDSVVKKSKPAD